MNWTHRNLAVLALLAATSGLAHATPVTVTGGFNSFSGPAYNGIYGGTTLGTYLNTGSGNTTYSGGPISFGLTSSVSFGCTAVPDPFQSCGAGSNILSFVSAGPQEVAGTGSSNEFLLGWLNVTDGSWFTSELTSIGLRLTTSSSNAALDGQVLDALVSFTAIWPGGGDDVCFSGATVDAAASATCLRVGNTFPGQAQVTGVVALYGYINSLHLSRVEQVPEPGTLGLLGLGLAGLSFARWRRACG